VNEKSDASEFGRTIRGLREKRSITLREMSRRVGVSAGYLSQVERGNFPPPSEYKIKALAKALEVDQMWLLTLGGRLPTDLTTALLKKFAGTLSEQIQGNATLSSEAADNVLHTWIETWAEHFVGDESNVPLRTSDLYLASFLVAKGCEPMEMHRDKGQASIAFDSTATVRDLVTAYHARSGESAIPALAFVAAIHQMETKVQELDLEETDKAKNPRA
jgi:HTH-type transcriptional regulator, competence development regulator